MKTSAVLKKAKRYLAKSRNDHQSTDKESFICYSITSAAYSGSVSDKDSDRVQKLVQDRLSPHATLETWLEKVHHIPRVYYDAGFSEIGKYADKLQTTRHAWINSMIEEFEAKGD